MGDMGFIVFIILLFFVVLLLVTSVRIVPQASSYVLERLGAYHSTWQVGLHVKLPLLDKISAKVSLKEKVLDFPPQPVITKDNVTMQIDTVIFYQITDPKLFAYGVTNPIMAIEKLSSTTLRNIIGQLELDETLTSRELINTQMRAILDDATDPWGIKVNRVEVKNIMPPADIVDAMEKQMRAERERRRAVIEAEGFKASAILKAEGEKASRILNAEADKQSTILRAEASKEAQIREAEGQAEAILNIQQATAKGLEMLKAAKADQAVLALKSFEALVRVADGKATKLIIPSELSNVASLVAAAGEVLQMGKADETTV